MLETNYNYSRFSSVVDTVDLFKSTLPEMSKVRQLYESAKTLFNLPSTKVKLSIADGERIYRFDLLSPGVNKPALGYFIYIPATRRLDLYSADQPYSPIVQWRNKKVEYCSYPEIVIRAQFPKIFDKLINIT